MAPIVVLAGSPSATSKTAAVLGIVDAFAELLSAYQPVTVALK